MAFGNRLTRWVYDHSPAFFEDLMTNMYSFGRSRRKFGPQFNEYMEELSRSQWYSNDELQALQDEKIRNLIQYASKQVPYYENLFRHYAIDPMKITARPDLAGIPFLEKDMVQKQIREFRSIEYLDDRKVEHFQTSGTSGKALDVYVTPDSLKMEKAFVWSHRSWVGIKPGDRVAYFTGFPVVPYRRSHPPYWVYDRIENRMMFSLHHMSRENLQVYADQLEAFQPVFFSGYPAAIYLMALFLCDTNNHQIHPKGIFTTSETVMPHHRKVIEQAFGCQVFDWYGSVEYTGNIVQCEYQNYHIRAEYGIVEILNPDNTLSLPGQAGEIVATGLNNPAMPFIRYRTGDIAIPKAGSCPCGRGGHLVERIIGRVDDIIVTPDGRYISRLDFIFKGLSNIVEAQLVQESPEHLLVRIVPNQNYSDEDKTRVLSNLRERLGGKISIEFVLMDRIPRTANGKFRFVVSKVPLDLTGAHQTGEIIDSETNYFSQ